jgi:hypothetical protein
MRLKCKVMDCPITQNKNLIWQLCDNVSINLEFLTLCIGMCCKRIISETFKLIFNSNKFKKAARRSSIIRTPSSLSKVKPSIVSLNIFYFYY